MTKGQEWAEEYFSSNDDIKLRDMLNRKIEELMEELRDEYQKEVLKAWTAGYEFCEHLDKVFGGNK
jgi:hypothetical protein